jgi:hypothetical protein
MKQLHPVDSFDIISMSPGLLSINDRPLTAQQQEKEDQRVRDLMSSRSAKRRLQRTLDAETLQGRRLFKML